MKTMLVTAAAATALAVCAPGAGANALDTHWLKADAQANVSEIGTAKWMLTQTGDVQIQALARQLIRDHTKALRADQRVARSVSVKLVLSPTPQAAWNMRELRKEVALGDVNKAYALLEVADHRMNIQAAKEEAAHGNVAPVVALARASVPVLQTHLAMARRTLSNLT
jgi:predicted outer membrane protein